jgi:hypothetical protein
MDLSLLCRQHVPEAIERLLFLLRSDDHRAVAFAVGTILDRAHGKAPLVIEGAGALDITLMHLVAAKAIAEQLQQAFLAGQSIPPPDERGVNDVTNSASWQDAGPALE